MVIVDFSIHVHTVHIYVQMRYATLCIMMESNYILAVLYVGGFRTGTFSLFREVNGIEYLANLTQSSSVQPEDSSLVGDISILITFRLSGLPLLIVLANSFCLSTIRWYMASADMSSGRKFTFTISALSLLTEVLRPMAALYGLDGCRYSH